MKRLILISAVLSLWAGTAAFAATPFVPDEPIIPLKEISRGMKGVARTAASPGGEVISFPVEVIDVTSHTTRPHKLVLIKATGKDIERFGGIASGMSGSPVYFKGRLAGAISYNWSFSDHKIGQMTPIEEMVKVFEYAEDVPSLKTVPLSEHKPLSAPFQASGVSSRAREALSKRLGAPVLAAPAATPFANSGPVKKPRPGDAVSVQLAWGDAELGSAGTLSAVSKDGRFLAFGHSMKNWGAVAFPMTEATIHYIVPSLESPFKLASPGRFIGLVTQDRAEAIGGWFNRFAPAASVTLELEDRTEKTKVTRHFQTVPHTVAMTEVVPELLGGLIDSDLGRVGGGTARLSLTVTGSGLYPGWTWSDVVFDQADLSSTVTSLVGDAISSLANNPFVDIQPMGIKLKLSVSKKAEGIYLEKLTVDRSEVAPGDTVEATVVMRPWRGKAQAKKFSLVVPEHWSGSCAVTVRGGQPSSDEEESSAKRPSSLKEFLQELSSREKASEVIVELSCDDVTSPDEEGLSAGEIRRARMKDGVMRVFQSQTVVEGTLTASFTVE